MRAITSSTRSRFNYLHRLLEIEKLQGTSCLTTDVGINISDINKLKAQGLTTVKAVQMVTTRNLLKIKGFSEAKVDKIKDSAAKLIANGFVHSS